MIFQILTGLVLVVMKTMQTNGAGWTEPIITFLGGEFCFQSHVLFHISECRNKAKIEVGILLTVIFYVLFYCRGLIGEKDKCDSGEDVCTQPCSRCCAAINSSAHFHASLCATPMQWVCEKSAHRCPSECHS